LQQVTDFAFILLDEEGRVVAWLGGAEKILGYRADEMRGMPLGLIFTEDDLQRGFDKYELEVARSCARSEDERWHVRKDGMRIWATGSVSAIRRGGDVLGFVKILRDRTDVRTRIDTLDNSVAALRASREETNLVLQTLGHELRNPLAPMLNAVHLLGRACEDGAAAHALQILRRQIAVLQRLAEDLVDASRVATGKVHLQRQGLDLRQLVEEEPAHDPPEGGLDLAQVCVREPRSPPLQPVQFGVDDGMESLTQIGSDQDVPGGPGLVPHAPATVRTHVDPQDRSGPISLRPDVVLRPVKQRSVGTTTPWNRSGRPIPSRAWPLSLRANRDKNGATPLRRRDAS
jgi:PAS domain S-box-containing protein